MLAGYKRATNIIRIEEKKDGREYIGAPDPCALQQAEEKALAQAIDVAKAEATHAVAHGRFPAAMRAMAKLRPHVDAFFDKVTVNVDDKPLRENRLKLLNEIRARDACRSGFFQDRRMTGKHLGSASRNGAAGDLCSEYRLSHRTERLACVL